MTILHHHDNTTPTWQYYTILHQHDNTSLYCTNMTILHDTAPTWQYYTILHQHGNTSLYCTNMTILHNTSSTWQYYTNMTILHHTAPTWILLFEVHRLFTLINLNNTFIVSIIISNKAWPVQYCTSILHVTIATWPYNTALLYYMLP